MVIQSVVANMSRTGYLLYVAHLGYVEDDVISRLMDIFPDEILAVGGPKTRADVLGTLAGCKHRERVIL